MVSPEVTPLLQWPLSSLDTGSTLGVLPVFSFSLTVDQNMIMKSCNSYPSTDLAPVPFCLFLELLPQFGTRDLPYYISLLGLPALQSSHPHPSPFSISSQKALLKRKSCPS